MSDPHAEHGRPFTRRQFIGGASVSIVGLISVACSSGATSGPTTKSTVELLPTNQLFDPLQPPTQLRLSLREAGTIGVSWIGGCVRQGEPNYQLYLDGRRVTTTRTLSATLRDIAPGEHAVAVATIDASGAESARTPESVVMLGDNSVSEAGTLPLVLEAVPAAGAIQFRWTLGQSYTGPQPYSYRLLRTDLPRALAITTRDSAAADTWYFATGITAGVIREYSVEAMDEGGSAIGRSMNRVKATSYRRDWPSDYPRPNVATSVRGDTDQESATITWTPPSDAVDTNVFADGKFVAQFEVGRNTLRSAVGSPRRQVWVRSVSRWGASSDASDVVSAPCEAPPREIFSTRNGLIFDPSGAPFVPAGANVSGPDFFWNEKIFGTALAARDKWRMTAIRLDCGMRDWGAVGGAQGNIFFSNSNLDRIVKEYTDAGLVVIIAQFNKTVVDASSSQSGDGLLADAPGSAPDGTGRSLEDATTDWWIEVARRYRSNPRVWLNPINEPRDDIDGLEKQYARMLTRIRAVAPLTPVVLDAANFANDIPNDADIADGPIRADDSFVMRHGPELFEKFGEPAGFGPVIFSIHAYSRWPRNYETNAILSDSKLADRMRAYVRDVRALSLPLVVGETGVEDFAREFDSASVRVGLYEQGSVGGITTGVWPEQQVGVIAWHASPVSGMPLSSGQWYSVDDINDTAPPPDAGRGIWTYGHRIRP